MDPTCCSTVSHGLPSKGSDESVHRGQFGSCARIVEGHIRGPRHHVRSQSATSSEILKGDSLGVLSRGLTNVNMKNKIPCTHDKALWSLREPECSVNPAVQSA
jgi:hypothetical protein